VVSALEVRVSTMSNVASNAASVASDARSIANAVSQAHSVLSAAVAAISVRLSTGGTSVRGLQSVINTLSNRISANSGLGGGGGSVTSTEFSALEVRVSALSAAPAGVSVTSTELSAAGATLSARIDSVYGVSAKSGATSVKGLQSALNAIQNRVSANSGTGGGGSVTSTEFSAALAVSARSVGVSVKGLQSALNALSNTLSDAMSVGSATGVNLSARVNSVNTFLGGLSVRLSTGGTSVKGLQSVLNTLSNRISANSAAGGGGSVTSTEHSALEARVSALSTNLGASLAQMSLDASALSTALVVLSNQVSALSAFVAAPKLVRMTTGPQAVNTSVLTDLSGLVFTVAAGEQWHVSGMMFYSTSAATQGLRVGFSVPPLSTPRYAIFQRYTAVQSAVGMGGAGLLQVSGNSVIMSVTSTTPAGAMNYVRVGAVLNVASAGTVRLMAAGIASTTASPINVAAGSYMMARRVL
jgi:hypothetical protein